MEGGEVTEELIYPATIANKAGEDYDDSDRPCLSSHTLAALKEFFLQNKPTLDPAADNVEKTENNGLQADLLPEDWRLSQFWYDPATAQVVAEELHYLSRLNASTVACVACPTLYVQLKKSSPEVEARIFEFDKRFEKYGTDFIFYDYNHPEDLPAIYRHKFQVVVADPPYLSEECLVKVSKTMMLLANENNAFFLLLTGKVQQELAAKLLNARPCGFQPTHHHKLGNEFMLFTNYDPKERLGRWADFN